VSLFGYGPTGGPVPAHFGSDPTVTFGWAGSWPYEDPSTPTPGGGWPSR
jgi:hypothetical protein